MKNHEDNPKHGKIGKRTAILYGVLALLLLGSGLTARYATGVKLHKADPAPKADESASVPSAKFDLSELDSYTASAANTAPSSKETTPSAATTNTESEPDRAVLAQKDGIERAETFSLPMGKTVDKPFSNGEMVQSKTMGDWRAHNGVDFRGTVGDPVIAVNNGIVKAVYDDVLWGTVVEIDHGHGLLARYCGLGKGSTVEVGTRVKINDRIGNLGAVPIESADEVHLHFETRQDGKAVEPFAAMGLNADGESIR